jgi:hypothetical protein
VVHEVAKQCDDEQRHDCGHKTQRAQTGLANKYPLS